MRRPVTIDTPPMDAMPVAIEAMPVPPVAIDPPPIPVAIEAMPAARLAFMDPPPVRYPPVEVWFAVEGVCTGLGLLGGGFARG